MFIQLLQSISQNLLYFMLHLTSGNSFPKPLSLAEETKALKAFHEQGDMKAREKLINHNMRLVAHIVKKYYANYSDQDDIISIGTIGLIKGIDSFDYTKSTRLATYASRCIENEILMHFRAKKKTEKDVSMNEPIDMDSEGNPLTFTDIIYSESTVFDEVDLKMRSEKLYQYLKKLSDPRERQILVMRYGLYDTTPLPQREVAEKLGISRSYVSRIEKRALSELRKMFDGDTKG